MTITEAEKTELVARSAEVRLKAYAPYSKFLVGAAILAGDGKIYTGSNMENQSYGLTICAERSACCKMTSEGITSIKAIAISTNVGCSPCGACRQVLAEFTSNNVQRPSAVGEQAQEDYPVFLYNTETKTLTESTIKKLLPTEVAIASLLTEQHQ